jgi:hypothetical protein
VINANGPSSDVKGLIALVEAQIKEIDFQLGMLSGVVALQNSVVRTYPGLYLVPRDGGYGVGSITKGVVCWSPEDAELMAAEVGKSTPGAKAVPFVLALREERAALVELARSLVEKLAEVAA